MREVFVTELVKEVLGPRGGITEVMQTSPLNEYITGVLAPIMNRIIYDVEAESELPQSESQLYEEETGDVLVHVPPLLPPTLDPRSRPSSMGVSFVIETSNVPGIEVCLTWARYVRMEEMDAWKRLPRYFLKTIILDRSHTYWIGPDGNETNPDNAEISLHLIVRPRDKNRHFVTLYLVNRIKFSPSDSDELPRAEHHIFQPQIRVVCLPDTKIVSGIEKMQARGEERDLAFLYRSRPIIARGHLCSAVWNDIDPEKPYDGALDFPECKNSLPFHWIDGELLSEDQRRKFSSPHVRTEFVPVYAVRMPDFSWRGEYGNPPEMRAEVLAEAWDRDELRKMLEPILNGYKRWTQEQREHINHFSPNDQGIALELIERCEKTLIRIREGIELLYSDDDARLAFCFANKALSVQRLWTKKEELVWRPFQLAFILMALESIANKRSLERNVCDLLWAQTGAGKTEAYLSLAIFAMAYRRRRSLNKRTGNRTGAGVSVITRYTLRLLTIQQFRRALAAVTACEYLRVWGMHNGEPIGWRPRSCSIKDNLLWGSTPFSIGLWVGGGVTPNRLQDTWGGNQTIYGALSILKGNRGEGEPAQVLNCPACGATLAVTEKGLRSGQHTLHFVIRASDSGDLLKKLNNTGSSFGNIKIISTDLEPHKSGGYFTLSLLLEVKGLASAADIDNFWKELQQKLPNVQLVPVRASRLGYFFRSYAGAKGQKEYDFDIFCPNPKCPLRMVWAGGAPSGMVHGRIPQVSATPEFPDGNRYIDVPDPFQNGSAYFSDRIPIPALTVDDQIYHRIPSMVVATVDKFARPPFEPRASALFGNVEYHHCIWGYYRQYQHPSNQDHDGHPPPAGHQKSRHFVPVSPLDPPDLIIQDELHLIEGPLGSLVGFYESAVEFLCQQPDGCSPKYVASTATVRRAEEQVQSVFARKLHVFPPPGLTADDRFFLRDSEIHPLDDRVPGRLYIGICAPGRGPLTPLVRIWARLLQTAWNNRTHPLIDAFWTLTGYFNSIRELAGARALYRQDLKERLDFIARGNVRQIPEDKCQELSSRTDSTELPAVLDLLNKSYPDAQDALLTTSMFGTGIDIPRIGLMVVNGQPKTTSAYIQSTGRVGRSHGGLVITFLRASRPRDLNHYEFFCGYHRQLYRFIEPATVYPFARGVIERAGGPLCVFMLRNMRDTSVRWHAEDTASQMKDHRTKADEVNLIISTVEKRAESQPRQKASASGDIRSQLESMLDRWQNIARNYDSLKYVEYAIASKPRYPVVLGDPQHQHRGLPVVYENVPQSLRHIEETTGFET